MAAFIYWLFHRKKGKAYQATATEAQKQIAKKGLQKTPVKLIINEGKCNINAGKCIMRNGRNANSAEYSRITQRATGSFAASVSCVRTCTVGGVQI